MSDFFISITKTDFMFNHALIIATYLTQRIVIYYNRNILAFMIVTLGSLQAKLAFHSLTEMRNEIWLSGR